MLYAGLTAVMLVALIGVLLLLSRQPLVALTPETSGTGWQVVDTPAQTFSLNLPDSWEVIRTPEDLGRDHLEIALEHDPELGRAAGPLATLAPDAELRLVARNVGQQPATLVVVQSDNLSRLSPSEIVTSIRSGDLGEFEVLSSATAEGIDGYTQAQFALRYPENVRCEQRVVPRADTAFIVSACAPFDQYPLYSVGFETLLDSFQTLQR